MRNNKFNRIVDKLVEGDIYEENINLTEEELNFLQKNPFLLKKITDSTFIKKRYIYMLFALSIILGTIAKIIDYTEFIAQYKIANDLLTNVLFSISMEMMGATIIAYFMEIILENRMKKNQILIERIQNRMSKKE